MSHKCETCGRPFSDGWKDHNELRDRATKLFLVSLVVKIAILSHEERQQFRRNERMAFLRELCSQHNPSFLELLSNFYYTSHLLPRLNELLRSKGLYVRPIRPKKPTCT